MPDDDLAEPRRIGTLTGRVVHPDTVLFFNSEELPVWNRYVL